MADNIKVKDLPDTSSIQMTNELMVLVDSANNEVNNITISNFNTNIISSAANNSLQKGADNKLYVKDAETVTGELSNLTTTNKTNLVNAINEVNGKIDPVFINNSKALETGAVNDNNTIYENIYKYAHSTYDSTKFTVAGSPTITADGIISDISNANYIYASNINLNADSFEIGIEANITAFPATQRIFQYKDALIVQVQTNGRVRFYASSTGSGYDIANAVESTNALTTGKHKIIAVFTGTQYKVYVDGEAWITVDSTSKIATQTTFYIFSGYTSQPMAGSQDLKTLYVITDNALAFSGTKTGTDIVKIGGVDTTIIYNLSKTGSKIVNSAYRTTIQNLYAQDGIAPYYTIDELNQNYTLPMGDIYGMISRIVPLSEYKNGADFWKLYQNGELKQGGSCTSGTAVTFLKAFADTNYILSVPYSAKSVTGFTPSQTGDWFAFGNV